MLDDNNGGSNLAEGTVFISKLRTPIEGQMQREDDAGKVIEDSKLWLTLGIQAMRENSAPISPYRCREYPLLRCVMPVRPLVGAD